ncbi:MAG: ABC transporter substrate-binding protein [Candidatus Aerophobetes bacterium]|nr:ABC transporter substrate-binding protein [Candidatus Aerophobetes bacterium]
MKINYRLISLLVALFILIGYRPIFPLEKSSLIMETITITDDVGREVTIKKNPQRIVSLSPSNTEILFALALGDKIVGVTDQCDYPPRTEKINKIGGYFTPNVEKIIAQKPDLVLAAYGNKEESIATLKKLGLPVVGLDPKNLEDILKDIQLVGKITDREEKAKKITSAMRKRIEAVKSRNAGISPREKIRVLYLCWYPELWTAGRGTYPDELIRIAGGKNIVDDMEGWKMISKETVIARDPEVIICSGNGGKSIAIKKNILKDNELQKISAVKDNRVYALIDADIIELPGPRIVEGLEKIEEYLHQ